MALTDHFTVALFTKTVSAAMTCQCYEAQKFEPDAILFGAAQCKKNDILMFYGILQGDFGCNQIKYPKITVTHVCFIALILATSLARCLNTRPLGKY